MAGVMLLAAAPAGARRVGVLVPEPPKGATTPATTSELRASLAEAIRAAGDEPDEEPVARARTRRAAGAVEVARLDVFATARQAAQEGWKAYLKVETAYAVSRLASARQHLATLLELDGALDLVADVSLRLGAVRLALKTPAEAREAFALAAALDPERELAAAEFAPDVVAAYEQARKNPAPPATLVVNVAGARQATIEVDGGAAVAAPARLDVTQGEHVVVARAAGWLAGGQIVKVPAGGATVEVALDEDVVGRALDGQAGAGAGLVAATMTYAELDGLVIVASTWRGGGRALVGQRCRLDPIGCGSIFEVRFQDAAKLGDAAVELWRKLSEGETEADRGPTLLEDERLVAPGKPPPGAYKPPTNGDETRPWWKNKWVWIGAGAVVVLGGGGYLLLSGDGGIDRILESAPGEWAP